MTTTTKLFLAAMNVCVLAAGSANAMTSSEEKLEVSPRARVLMDGALYMPSDDVFTDGVAIPDVELGFKARYGRWSAKADICLAYGKVSPKDIYLSYDLGGNQNVYLGYMSAQLGLNSVASSSMKQTMEEQPSDIYFNASGRNMLLMYVYSGQDVLSATSVIADGRVVREHANRIGKVSMGVRERVVYRRADDEMGRGWHVGMSGGYEGARHERLEDGCVSGGYFDFEADFPSRVSQVEMLGARVDGARGVMKLTPELLLWGGRFAVESQYYYMNVWRGNGLASYKAHGAYGMVRGLLRGRGYRYNGQDGILDCPDAGSVELTGAFDWTGANCNSAGIYGGVSRDVSLTASYYINRYVLARLRYSWNDVRDRAGYADRHVNIVQARLQIMF